MTQQQIVAHWRKGSRDSMEVARMCLEAQKFEHALFAAHLAVEKALKARFIEKHDDAAPFTHELHALASHIPLNLSGEQISLLREMSRLAVRARYADHQWSEEQATAKNAEYWVSRAEELLQSILES
ncbi:MAG: HEPN domain-containing protein [Candidatus Peregrinibacteria bacterium]